MSQIDVAILSANKKFYQALSLADAAVMRGLWIKSPDATCVHPGWSEIIGYDKIQETWSVMFTHQGPIHIWPSNEKLMIEGEVVWVLCFENIDASATAANTILRARARNAFRGTQAGWKLLHHLVEAALGAEVKPPDRRLASN